jgi:hypothetical protein
MSLIRVLLTSQVTLSHEFRVDEQLTDASGSVTATVKRLDGTSIVGSPFTAAHASLGVYTFALPGQAQLDSLTIDWSGSIAGATIVVRDYAEVVGGFLFGLAELRTRHALSSTYTTAALADARTEVEQECERICGQSFTPRFARVALGGSGLDTVVLPRMNVRAVRAVTVDGVSQLAPVEWAESGVLTMSGGVWPIGRRNIIVEFEYGWDGPPEYIRTAAMLRCKTLLSQPKSGIPARAASFSLADGGVYRLSLPSRESTGIPEVDGAYAKDTVDLDLGWL